MSLKTGHESLKLWIALTLVGGLIGAAYSILIGSTIYIGVNVGMAIAGSIMGLEMFIVQRRYGEVLRTAPLAVYFTVMTLAWLLIIAVCLQLVPRFYIGHATYIPRI